MYHLLSKKKQEEEERQKLKREEMINYSPELAIYKNKGVLKIKENELKRLKGENYLRSNQNNRIPSIEENLIINNLPPEILIMICEYLSPGEFGIFGMTCAFFREIYDDQETWRKIAKSYNEFFICDYYEFNNDIYRHDLFGFQTPIHQEMEIIKTEKQKEDFPNLSRKHFEKWNEKREKRLKQYFNNGKIDESTMKDEHWNRRLPVLNSTEEERVEYINLLENPKEEMLEKGRKIYELFLEEKKRRTNLEKYSERQKELRHVKKKEERFFIFFGILFLLGFSVYIILITLKIERKIESKLSYLSISTLIPLFGLLIVLVYDLILKVMARKMKYYLEEDLYFVSLSFCLLVFIGIVLIGLKVDHFMKCSWLIVLIPFILYSAIFSIFLFVYILILYWKQRKELLFIALLCFWFIPFLVFLGLKLDGKIKWNYGIVFIPLFLQVLSLVASFFLTNFWGNVGGFITKMGIFLILFFWIIFLIIFIIYLEKDGIYNIYYPFIPIYIFFGISDIFGCISVILGIILPDFQ
ncbi:dactylin [Anaeramoeba ignava]|uniref:Dactylin n=1 Tax=Anaeramoeba ignava TaxID=1746090 RepID=A0A9Q0LFK6_ANAIG|nr:dactylin [Anaeramoeba ignava]